VGNEDSFTLPHEVSDNLAALFVAHLSADGHLDKDIIAIGTALVTTSSGLAVLSTNVHLLAKAAQIAYLPGGNQPHVAATAAIATIGTTPGHVLLASKADRPIATLAAPDVDGRSIEHGCTRSGAPRRATA
jgi:hypothetical protein